MLIIAESGQPFKFVSEAAYNDACDWYDKTAKSDIIAFCENVGARILIKTKDRYYKSGVKLCPNWALIAMRAYANNN